MNPGNAPMANRRTKHSPAPLFDRRIRWIRRLWFDFKDDVGLAGLMILWFLLSVAFWGLWVLARSPIHG